MFVLFVFVDACFVFFVCGAVAFVLLSVVFVCARSLPFAFVCLFVCLFVFLLACAGLHRLLLLGSDSTVVFVGVSCGEPGGNDQIAHSQIVVVIVFS